MRVVVTDKGIVTERSDSPSFDVKVPTTFQLPVTASVLGAGPDGLTTLATTELDATALPTVSIRSKIGRTTSAGATPFSVNLAELAGAECVGVDGFVIAKSADATVRKRWSHSALAYRTSGTCGFDEDVTTATKGNDAGISTTLILSGSVLQLACTGSATPLLWSWEFRLHKQKDT